MIKNCDRERIVQNLKDADCEEELIRKFTDELDNGRVKQALRLLEEHRVDLLERYHESQRSIDCLDYLVFQIEKNYM